MADMFGRGFDSRQLHSCPSKNTEVPIGTSVFTNPSPSLLSAPDGLSITRTQSTARPAQFLPHFIETYLRMTSPCKRTKTRPCNSFGG